MNGVKYIHYWVPPALKTVPNVFNDNNEIIKTFKHDLRDYKSKMWTSEIWGITTFIQKHYELLIFQALSIHYYYIETHYLIDENDNHWFMLFNDYALDYDVINERIKYIFHLNRKNNQLKSKLFQDVCESKIFMTFAEHLLNSKASDEQKVQKLLEIFVFSMFYVNNEYNSKKNVSGIEETELSIITKKITKGKIIKIFDDAIVLYDRFKRSFKIQRKVRRIYSKIQNFQIPGYYTDVNK